MRFLLAPCAAAATCAAAFVGTAAAATGLEPDGGSLLDLFAPIIEAIKGGQYAAAVFAMLSALVVLGWRYGSKHWAWLGTGEGKAFLTLLFGFSSTVGAGLAAGASLSGGLLWAALGTAVAMAGGYSLLKELLVPRLVWLQSREWMPGWGKTAIDLALWFFARDRATIAKAEAAGAAAVEASPASGVEGLLGKPRDL